MHHANLDEDYIIALVSTDVLTSILSDFVPRSTRTRFSRMRKSNRLFHPLQGITQEASLHTHTTPEAHSYA